MRTGATVTSAGTFGCIRAGLAAVLFALGYGTRALWVGTSILNSFSHDKSSAPRFGRTYDAGLAV